MSPLERKVDALLRMMTCDVCGGTGRIHTATENPSSFVTQHRLRDGKEEEYQLEIPILPTITTTTCACRLDARHLLANPIGYAFEENVDAAVNA